MIDMHTHTEWSMDGMHRPEEIIEHALSKGISILGISDHLRSVLLGSTNTDNLKKYIHTIGSLKEAYSDKITILCGIEINVNLVQNEALPYEALHSLDYVILEHINGTSLIDSPKTSLCIDLHKLNGFCSNFSCPVGLAHTDLLKLSRLYETNKAGVSGLDYVLKVMAENHLFWEINTHPLYKYFDYIVKYEQTEEVKQLIKKLKEYNIKAAPASDTHGLAWDFSYDRLKTANRLAEEIGMAF